MHPLPPLTDDHGAHVIERLRNALSGHYELEGEIGRGGMARVYRARDLRHERQVAVKVLPPDLTTAMTSERFVFEIRTAAKLLHPHILGLIDSGDAEGLLYYIMPHVDGESLRERLTRERVLPVAEAARIVREVASALAHAHQHGVVHRDIKPENVLLVDGTHAVVADFGLATAILRSTDRSLTQSSHIVGTVNYMSPEQAGSGHAIDGRADLYSLGCMFFEMVTGRPPFEGHSPYAVLAQHMSAEPPRIAGPHSTVPLAIERVIHRAMEKDPERRYQSATELCDDLDAALASGRPPWYVRATRGRIAWRRARRDSRVTALTAMAAVAGIAALAAVSPWGGSSVSRLSALLGPRLDTTRLVIFPLRVGAGVPIADEPHVPLHDAFERWTGIVVADQQEVADAVAELPTPTPAPEELARIARRLRAGRFVRGGISVSGDSLRIQATLYDARTVARVANATAHISRGGLASAAPFHAMADDLLFRDSLAAAVAEGGGGTTSYAAMQAFALGWSAFHRWDLPRADSALSQAVSHDPDFAAAHLWLAQTRGWSAERPRDWRMPAERAVQGKAELPERAQLLAAALLHMADDEFPEACAAYADLKRRNPQDFLAAYGLGECVRRDPFVVPDPRSPSNWRFRGSWDHAMKSYQEAFELLPSINREFPPSAPARLRSVLMTRTNARIKGRTLRAGPTTFTAAPSWERDTLVLIPYPDRAGTGHPGFVISESSGKAIEQQRIMFRDIAASWRRGFPDAVGPREVMAVAMELLGDSTALDTLREARRLATEEQQQIRLAAQEVWLRVKFALPDGRASLVLARTLADSLLDAVASSRDRSPESAGVLASLAMLTGRVHEAAALASRAARPGERDDLLTSRALGPSQRLLAFAAAGAPAESILAIEAQIVDIVQQASPRAEHAVGIRQFLGQAAGLAFPVQRLENHRALAGAGNPVLDAQWALARGDSAGARRILKGREADRALSSSADLTLDITYPAAWTLARTGDRASATSWIGPVLDAAPYYAPDVINRIANAGGLMRGMALRAELAHQAGDTDAASRWASAVLVLWAGADPTLRPAVQQMRSLASAPAAPRARGR